MKKTFVMYTDWIDMMRVLDDESRGILMLAVFEYAKSGVAADLASCPTAAVVFAHIKARMDEDSQKYEEIVEKNRANGQKGGRPKKNPENETEKNPPVFSKTQKNIDNDNENENDNVIDNDNVIVNDDAVDDNDNVNDIAAYTREETSAVSADKNNYLNIYETLIGEVTQRVAEVFNACDLPDELKKHAIEEAHDNGKKSLKYIEGILGAYKRDGVRTLADAKNREERHRAAGRAAPIIQAVKPVPPILQPAAPQSRYDYDEIERLDTEWLMKETQALMRASG